MPQPTPLSDPYALGQALQSLRKQRRMTQGAVAHALGVAPSQVSRFENGKRPMDTQLLDRYARVLGLEATVMFETMMREQT